MGGTSSSDSKNFETFVKENQEAFFAELSNVDLKAKNIDKSIVKSFSKLKYFIIVTEKIQTSQQFWNKIDFSLYLANNTIPIQTNQYLKYKFKSKSVGLIHIDPIMSYHIIFFLNKSKIFLTVQEFLDRLLLLSQPGDEDDELASLVMTRKTKPVTKMQKLDVLNPFLEPTFNAEIFQSSSCAFNQNIQSDQDSDLPTSDPKYIKDDKSDENKQQRSVNFIEEEEEESEPVNVDKTNNSIQFPLKLNLPQKVKKPFIVDVSEDDSYNSGNNKQLTKNNDFDHLEGLYDFSNGDKLKGRSSINGQSNEICIDFNDQSSSQNQAQIKNWIPKDGVVKKKDAPFKKAKKRHHWNKNEINEKMPIRMNEDFDKSIQFNNTKQKRSASSPRRNRKVSFANKKRSDDRNKGNLENLASDFDLNSAASRRPPPLTFSHILYYSDEEEDSYSSVIDKILNNNSIDAPKKDANNSTSFDASANDNQTLVIPRSFSKKVNESTLSEIKIGQLPSDFENSVSSFINKDSKDRNLHNDNQNSFDNDFQNSENDGNDRKSNIILGQLTSEFDFSMSEAKNKNSLMNGSPNFSKPNNRDAIEKSPNQANDDKMIIQARKRVRKGQTMRTSSNTRRSKSPKNRSSLTNTTLDQLDDDFTISPILRKRNTIQVIEPTFSIDRKEPSSKRRSSSRNNLRKLNRDGEADGNTNKAKTSQTIPKKIKKDVKLRSQGVQFHSSLKKKKGSHKKSKHDKHSNTVRPSSNRALGQLNSDFDFSTNQNVTENVEVRNTKPKNISNSIDNKGEISKIGSQNSSPKKYNQNSSPKKYNQNSSPKKYNQNSSPKKYNQNSSPKKYNQNSSPKKCNQNSSPKNSTNKTVHQNISNSNNVDTEIRFAPNIKNRNMNLYRRPKIPQRNRNFPRISLPSSSSSSSSEFEFSIKKKNSTVVQRANRNEANKQVKELGSLPSDFSSNI